MACVTVKSLDDYPRLERVPPHRLLPPSNFLARMRRAVAFEHIYVSGLDIHGYQLGRGRSVDTDLPAGFIDAYLSRGLKQYDPLISASKDIVKPIDDDEANDRIGAHPRLETLKRTFGVRNRYFVPISRDGSVFGGVFYSNSTPFTTDDKEYLTVAAELIYRTLTRPLMERFAASVMGLTSGELACLRLASHGYTSEEIATRAGYQVETVNTYLKVAARKIGAANRPEAIAEAIRRQLIN